MNKDLPIPIETNKARYIVTCLRNGMPLDEAYKQFERENRNLWKYLAQK